jgi:YVTN family beta-propeller protein
MRKFVLRSAVPAVFVCLMSAFWSAPGAAAQTVIGKIPVAGFPGQGAFDRETQETYIPTGTDAVGTSAVTVISNKNTVARIITLPTNWGTETVALNPITRRLYIGTGNGGLFIVDPSSGMLTGFIGVNAASVVVNQFKDKVYVSDFDHTLYVIDGATNDILKTIDVSAIENLAINPVRDRIYAAQDLFPGQITVVNGKTDAVIKEVQAGGALTFSVTADPLTDRFYSADQLGTVSVFDARHNTLKATIAVPGQPAGILVDPGDRKIYVTSASDNKVYVIDARSNRIVDSLAVGVTPEYLTLNPERDLVYVGNTGGTDANGNPVYSLSVIKEGPDRRHSEDDDD